MVAIASPPKKDKKPDRPAEAKADVRTEPKTEPETKTAAGAHHDAHHDPADRPAPRGRPTPLERAEAAVPDALRAKIVAIRDRLTALDDRHIMERYDLGVELNEIADNKTGEYGADPGAYIEAMMPVKRDSIRAVRVLAARYSRDEVKQFLTFRHPQTGESVTATHLAILCRVKDKDKAFKLAEKAVTQSWSTKDLARHVIAASGGPRSKGGRKRKRSATLEGCVQDVIAVNTAWGNAADGWLDDKGVEDLYDAAGYGPKKPPPDDAVAGLQAMIDSLDRLVVRAREVTNVTNTLLLRAKAAREAAAKRLTIA